MRLNKQFKKIKHFACNAARSRYSHRRVNGDNKNINAIRAGYLAQIEAKQKEIADLREKLKRAEQVDKEAEMIFDPVDKYRGMGMTEAVIDAVNTLNKMGLGENGGVSAGQVCDYLKGHGFNFRTPNFTVSVYVTLQRLSNHPDCRIVASRESGKKRYLPIKKI
ncbi:MAG: hypothetical protein ABR955_05015 [Verrucomicrobiota bacterium]|jgi:hypothetical protein